VVYSGGVFAMVYDGSAAGVASALDLDAIQPMVGPAGFSSRSIRAAASV
jgi:hypothetical protein